MEPIHIRFGGYQPPTSFLTWKSQREKPQGKRRNSFWRGSGEMAANMIEARET
jgi:hypothetical protein